MPTEPLVLGRQAGFGRDLLTVAGRALRQIPREPVIVIPALVVPGFFYAINLGAFSGLARHVPGLDYKAFLLPLAIAFAVTGVSRASTLVVDVANGYFDRLCLTPVHRLALLLGLMVADLAVVVVLCIPLLGIAAGIGVHFQTGLPGMVAFVAFAACWGLAFTCFSYAVALKTGNPAAVNACFISFFPFFFLTDAQAPQKTLTGWFGTIARYNPVTYLIDALRTLVTSGWDPRPLLEGVAVVVGIAIISLSTALLGLRSRTRPKS